MYNWTWICINLYVSEIQYLMFILLFFLLDICFTQELEPLFTRLNFNLSSKCSGLQMNFGVQSPLILKVFRSWSLVILIFKESSFFKSFWSLQFAKKNVFFEFSKSLIFLNSSLECLWTSRNVYYLRDSKSLLFFFAS